MAKIADLIVSLSADVAQFRTSMAESAESVKTLGESFEDAKKKVEKLVEFLAVAEGVKFIKEAVDATEEWAFSIQKLTQLTGQSSESAATFAAVAREEGVSTDVVTTAISRLSLALATHPQKFQQLGIAIRDARGQLLPMQQILANTTKGLDQFKIGADRDAAAAVLLGKGFAGLLPDLQRLAPELTGPNWEKARQLIEGLGLAIDEHGIAKAREWEKAEADLGLVFLAVQNKIGQALIPILTQLGTTVTNLIRNGDLKRWADDAASAFSHLVNAATDLKTIMGGFTTAPELSGESIAQLNTGLTNAIAERARLQKQLESGGATTDFKIGGKPLADIELVRSELAQVDREIQARKDRISSLSTPTPAPQPGTGDEDNPAGTKSFTPPPTAAEISAAEKFQKLTTELTAQRAEQDALSEAWKRGGVEAQSITDRFDAFKASLALGKDNTDAQRAAIDKLSLSVKNAAEQAKLNEQVSKFSATATNQIQFQKDLSAAYAAGGTAVESITAKEKAHQAVLALGLNATEAAKKAVNDLSLAESQATNDAKRVETLAKSSELLQENTAYQGRLTEAYREGGRAVLGIEDSEKAYQAVLALGKNATAGQIAQVTQLSLANSAATRLTAQAATANQDLIDAAKGAGGALESALGQAIKPGSDLLKIFTDLGAALEELVIKATIFKPLERSLDNFLSGVNPTTGAATGNTSSAQAQGAQQGGIGTVLTQLFAPVLSLFGINIATQTTATTAQTAASVTETTAATALTTSAAALTAAAAALTASAGGSAASSGLSGLFGSGLDGLGNSAGSGAGAGVASSVRSTSLGNPVAPNFFRPPDVRGSAASAAPTVNIHGVTNPEKATVNHKQKATGGYDIEVYLADSVAKNIRSGGKIAQAQRDTFGNNRVAIQR